MISLSRRIGGLRSSQNPIPLIAVAVSVVALFGSAAAQTGGRPTPTKRSCASLSSLTNFQFSVVEARMEPASEDAPEHCRVYGRILPDIRFAVYLPFDWNGRLQMQGNGGWAGSIREGGMRSALRDGSVSVGTDTGHDRRREPGGIFTLDRQKVIDCAYRSVHLTVEAAKQITAAYYPSPIQYSYFVGCSTGGRQALTEAQRFPADFDGILVGAPILDYVGTNLSQAWEAPIMERAAIEVEQLGILAVAVYEKCDGSDGLEDGVIENPPACGFDPATDLPVCDGASAEADCFTQVQIDALKKVYDGPPFFPGRVVGAEVFVEGRNGRFSPWQRIIDPPVGWFAAPFLKYMAFEVPDTTYDWRTFDFVEDLPKVEWLRRIIDATDPDLRRFREHGGKMLMYFGWADTALNPLRGVQYYEAVLDEMGPSTTDFFRLFMIPGMFHCGGGVGVNRFEHDGEQNAWYTDYLQDWVEQGVPPEQLSGLRVEQERVLWTRPICLYPRVARYTGRGDSDAAANFVCRDS